MTPDSNNIRLINWPSEEELIKSNDKLNCYIWNSLTGWNENVAFHKGFESAVQWLSTCLEPEASSNEQVTIPKEAYDLLIKRNQKLKRIEDMLEKAYETDEYGELTGPDDLGSIGESTAMIMGYL